MESPGTDRLLTRAMDAVAAGTSDQNSNSIPIRGFVDHVFTALFGTITAGAVTSVKIQESPDDSAWTDVSGATVTVADTDDDDAKSVRVGVEELIAASTHLRAVVLRATQNAVIDGVVCWQRKMTA